MSDTTKIDKELERLVREEFGAGGWGWDNGVMPYIKLTLPEAQALAARLLKEEKFKSRTDEFHFNLVRAEQHTKQAHDMLYSGSGPTRGFWVRTALGRAQSTLMSLWVKELRKKEA